MENAAILVLMRHVAATNERLSAVWEEIREQEKKINSYNWAIDALKNQSSLTRSRQLGTRLEDRIVAEIRQANGTKSKFIAHKLTKEGRPTKETTVSGLIFRLIRKGVVVRRNGLFYAA